MSKRAQKLYGPGYQPHGAEPNLADVVPLDSAVVRPKAGDAMTEQTLNRRAKARHRKRLLDALFHLAFVVRENIGRKVKRGTMPSVATRRLDKIRDAIADVDKIKEQAP